MSDALDPKNGNKENEYVVFSLDDKEIDNLGKVIGTKYAREFLKITQKEELNLKEIAKKVENNENPRLPNPTHHKKRLEKLTQAFGQQNILKKIWTVYFLQSKKMKNT